MPNILDQFSQPNAKAVAFAIAAGAIVVFADILQQYGTSYLGVLIAPALVNMTCIAVGIVTNYFLVSPCLRGLNAPDFCEPPHLTSCAPFQICALVSARQ